MAQYSLKTWVTAETITAAELNAWSHCRPCEVVWLGLEDCWTCGQPGRIGAPPRVKGHAVPIS